MQWQLKDGTLIDIESMDTKHIKNCIELLKKRGFVGYQERSDFLYSPKSTLTKKEKEILEKKIESGWIDLFQKELKRREANEKF